MVRVRVRVRVRAGAGRVLVWRWCGVVAAVVAAVAAVAGRGTFFERPKSVSFTWPLTWTITFSGLRSRKMTPCVCTCSSARASSAE